MHELGRVWYYYLVGLREGILEHGRFDPQTEQRGIGTLALRHANN